MINIGSMYSLFGSPSSIAYAASKGGIVQLTKSLATAWAQHGINVNAILPGWIETDMTAPINDQPDMMQQIVSRTPFREDGSNRRDGWCRGIFGEYCQRFCDRRFLTR